MQEIEKILKNLHPELDFNNSNDFINDGFLDSFDIITLVSELEEVFNISIDGLDIVPENFGNISQIASLVKKNGGLK